MWRVIASALVARRGQTVVVALVALLASAAVVTAPWYAVAATQRVGVAAVAGAPVSERLISVSWWLGPDDDAPPHPIATLRRQFDPKGFSSVGGGYASGDLKQAGGGAAVEVNFASRAHMCDHLVLSGSCPKAPGEIIVTRAVADRLRLRVGDRLTVTQGDEKLGSVRLVGLYQVGDPSDAYWGDGSLVGLSTDGTEAPVAFTVLKALPDYGQVTYTYDLLAAPQAFATTDVHRLQRTLEADLSQLRTRGYSASTSEVDGLIDRIARDRQNVTAGVVVGVVILLLLTWFTLVVVLRETVLQVRGDVGWWRLHGAPSGRGWVFVLGQSAIPLGLGAVVGGGLGLAFGRGLGGSIAGGAGGTALLISVLLVALTVAGGLVAVVAAQLGTMRTPVRDLLRGVPARRGRWRRSLVDLVLVVLAAAAVGQALTVGDVQGLSLFAPGLAVLALALIAGWAIPPLATWLTGRALHSGRLVVTLVSASMARRPGTHRLFALATVAVALVTTAFVGWDTGSRTETQRAELEAGAARVITVAPVDTAQLLAAVRAADPSGTQAMAVVQRPGIAGDPAMLALDTTRLDVVAGWRKAYGGDEAKVAADLRPAPPSPVVVTAPTVTVEASGASPSGAAMHLRLLLRSQRTGAAVDAVTPKLTAQRAAYEIDVPACARGCRLVGAQILGRRQSKAAAVKAANEEPVTVSGAQGETLAGYALAAAGAHVELYGLSGPGGKALAPGLFDRPARWRTGLGPRDLGPVIGPATGQRSGHRDHTGSGVRLTVRVPRQEVSLDRSDWAFVVDSPLPLPVMVAGWRPDPTSELRIAPLSGAAVPADIVRHASLIPVFGQSGVLVDLSYADRLVPFPLAGDTPQVWLSSSAPASVVGELKKAGLTPLRQDSLAAHVDRLRAEGSAVGVRFGVAVALVGLLLAAGAVLVHAAQERAGRVAELAALRAQGVGTPAIRMVGYGGLAAVLGSATVIGVAAGLVGAAIARFLYPGFVDGWTVLPTAPFGAVPIGGAAAVAVLVLGAAVVAAAVTLVRRILERPA